MSNIIVISKRRIIETIKVCRVNFEDAIEDMDSSINTLLKQYPEAYNIGPVQEMGHPTAYALAQQWSYVKDTEE